MKNISYLIMTTLIFGAVLTSCNENADNLREFIISFDSNGGSEVPPQTVREGDKAARPDVNPTLNGYTFVGWYKDVELANEWKFDTDVVAANITLYAEWIEDTDKEMPECYEFCLYADIESFYKTAPIINKYLSTLPESMSDEQKLQTLTKWLCSYSCVIDAKLGHVYTYPSDDIICLDGPCPPGTSGSIVILLDDNGITRELTLDIWAGESEPMKATHYSYVQPKEVRVLSNSNWISGTSPTTIHNVFDFINLFDHKALNIYKLGSEGYISSLPKDSLDYILANLNAKPYFSRVHGYWNEQLYIDVVMSNMENKAYQTDWFKFMNDYKLTEVTTVYSWFLIDFEVPDGKEREWMEKFNKYEFVYGANLNSGFRSME